MSNQKSELEHIKSVGILGLGLIGGSIALSLKPALPQVTFFGIDSNSENSAEAIELGLVDQLLAIDGKDWQNLDVLFICIPVGAIERFLPGILEGVSEQCIVIDTGSTKANICKVVEEHPKRNQYVAAHPIAGTENSGPAAAFVGLFNQKVNIVCEREKSSDKAFKVASALFSLLGMTQILMDAESHDKHLAYVSHLSHISSFMLGLTVLAIEKDEKNIFHLAGSGFESTVRLAKSSPEMWAPIFKQNKKYLSKALSEYVARLKDFQKLLDAEDAEGMTKTMQAANQIRKVLER